MDIKTKLIKARVRVLLQYPFFSFLLTYLKDKEMPEEMRQMGGLATDGEVLFYNPEWVEKTPLEKLCGGLVHEVCHPAFGTFWRRDNRDMIIWNVATDYTINSILKMAFEDLQKKLRQSGINVESDTAISLPDNVLLDSKFEKMSSEEVYNLLLKNAKSIKMSSHPWDKFCGGNELGEKKGKNGKSEKKTETNGKGNTLEIELTKQAAWKERLAQAATAAKMQGKLPAGFETLIDEILQPMLPWQMILGRYIQQAIYNDYRWTPPHLNHVWRGIYLPSEYGEMIEIAFATDDSGSIGDEELKDATSEVLGACKVVENFKIHYFACDAKIQEEKEITNVSEISRKFVGRGGTDFRPVFDRIKKRRLTPSVLIYFTDGDGTFPEQTSPYPVIWLLSKGDRKVPFGQKILYQRK